MFFYNRVPSRHTLAMLAGACLLGACATVDLGSRYDPPPVRAPQPLPPVLPPAAVTLPTTAQPQPVPPPSTVGQPLPPLSSTPPAPPVQAPVQTPQPADPRAHLVTFSARIDAASVVPPTRSAGSARLDAIYDSATRLFRWKASWSGLSAPITGVQFRGPADVGQPAPATMIWPGPFGPQYEGRATLTPQQATELIEGRWYVSIDTSAYPTGELRGQLRVVH